MTSSEPLSVSRRTLLIDFRRVMETLQDMTKVQRGRIVFNCVSYKGALPCTLLPVSTTPWTK